MRKKSRGKTRLPPAADGQKEDPGLDLRIDHGANLPVHAQLHQQLTWLIASGRLAADRRLPNVRELASELGINVRTVSQAYHALEDDGLIESRPRLGTRVRAAGNSLPLRRGSLVPSHTIGVFLPEMTPFYAQLLEGLEEAARDFGFLLITCFTHGDKETGLTLARELVAKAVDGLIVVATTQELNSTQFPGMPLVHVDMPHIHSNVILFNLERAGYLATHHLIWHGHRRIGLITAPLRWPNNARAAVGYRRALREAGLPVDEKSIVEVPGFSGESGYQAGKQLLKLSRPPTAVFASGDILAVSAMQALWDGGRRIPEDIAIASKDNIEFAGLSHPPLTSVSLPVFEAGEASMRLLHAIINGQASHRPRVLPGTRLVIRRSCGCELELTREGGAAR